MIFVRRVAPKKYPLADNNAAKRARRYFEEEEEERSTCIP